MSISKPGPPKPEAIALLVMGGVDAQHLVFLPTVELSILHLSYGAGWMGRRVTSGRIPGSILEPGVGFPAWR